MWKYKHANTNIQIYKVLGRITFQKIKNYPIENTNANTNTQVQSTTARVGCTILARRPSTFAPAALLSALSVSKYKCTKYWVKTTKMKIWKTTQMKQIHEYKVQLSLLRPFCPHSLLPKYKYTKYWVGCTNVKIWMRLKTTQMKIWRKKPKWNKYTSTKYNSHFRFCGPFVRTLCPPKH